MRHKDGRVLGMLWKSDRYIGSATASRLLCATCCEGSLKLAQKGAEILEKNDRYFGYSAWHMLLQGEMKNLEV